MSKPLAYELQRQVRADKRKEQAVFDEIHVLEHEGLLDSDIVNALQHDTDYCKPCKTKEEALLWLRKFKEQKMLDSEKDYLKEQARLSGEIDEIRKIQARMENRNGNYK